MFEHEKIIEILTTKEKPAFEILCLVNRNDP